MYGLPEFTFGLVLRQTFGLVGRHVGAFTAAGLLAFMPLLLIQISAADAGPEGALQVAGLASYLPYIALFSVLALLLLLPVLTGIVTRAVLGDSLGEPRSFGRDVAAALKLLLPNVAITVLFYMALIPAYTLLVVPGLILQCAWYIVVPAYMAERSGLFRCFGRSWALTKGHRWPVLGLWLSYVVVFGLLRGFEDDVVRVVHLGGGTLWAFWIVDAALTTGLLILGDAVRAVAYVELSRIDGGSPAPHLLEAFA